jgi:threonine/homoserine/homoserine lactone efflux protein
LNIENLFLFISIALISTITPGPAILLVSANSIKYGINKSILTILGNITGLFFMSLFAVLGLSTIILYSAPAFFAVKIIGALYLLYLGLKLWRTGFAPAKMNVEKMASKEQPPQNRRLYLQGLFIALSNPKAIAFTTALFPQFIDSNQALMNQFLVLVSIFMLLSFACLFSYAILAIKTKNRANNLLAHRLTGKLFGSIFIGSGIALAFTSQNKV